MPPPSLPPGWTTSPSPALPFRRPPPPTHRTHPPLPPLHPTPPLPHPTTPLTPPFSNSHYYRPRSTLTSPTRSNLPSPSVSPTRKSFHQRITASLAQDTLLSHLHPAKVRDLVADPTIGFSATEREWTLHAAAAVEDVGAWLSEVEA